MKKRILATAMIPLLLLSACGNERVPSHTVAVSDFVYYDFTRELTKDTDIYVELVPSEELSGRDKNKLKNADMIVGFDEYGASDTFFLGMNRIYIPSVVDAIELKQENNRMNDSSYRLFKKGEESSVAEPAINPNPSDETTGDAADSNNTTQSTEGKEDGSTNENHGNQNQETSEKTDENKTVPSENSETPSSSEQENKTDSSENSSSGETDNRVSGITILVNQKEDYSAGAPSSANASGYSVSSMPEDYELDSKDSYDSWVLQRIWSLENEQRSFVNYAALDDGNGGYTVFESVHNGISYKVTGHNAIGGIPVLPFFRTNYLFVEKKAENAVKAVPLAVTAAFDTNYWMDVKKSMKIVESIKTGLVKTYPEEKETIEKNYAEYIKRLESLDSRMQKAVDEASNGVLFVCGKFSYAHLVNGYGIDYISLYDYNYQDEMPSVSRLTAFADVLNSNRIKYTIKDKTSNTEAFMSLQDSLDHHVNVLVIDTMEKEADTEKTYLKTMEENLLILKKSIY